MYLISPLLNYFKVNQDVNEGSALYFEEEQVKISFALVVCHPQANNVSFVLYFYIEESWKYIQSKVFVPSPFFDVCLQRTQILRVGKSKCWKMLFKDMVYDVMYLKRLSLYLCNCIRRDPSYDWKTTFAVCHFQILKKYEVMPKMSGRADRYI